MTCTQCGGTELVEDALGKTIRCPGCAGPPDPVAEALVADCAIYLKDGETPRERMDRDHADVLGLMKLLEREKRNTEALQAEVARLRAALLDQQGPNLGGKTREPGLMTILTAHYQRDMTGADAADLAARYLDALKGGA